MRLLNVHTMELEEYFDESIPPYAILSHTWGKEEVTFQEWTSLSRHRKLKESFGKSIEYMFAGLELDTIHERSGYTKIFRCAQKARSDKIQYIWVDTCCIDKSSSAELSEAINSMFRWYRDSRICYAYLSDVTTLEGLGHENSDFRKSRWFTRGWTLQELLAPSELVFFDQGWNGAYEKKNISDIISQVTKIPANYISGASLYWVTIAQKMAWASRRETTRREDIAYCLLGIFGINMPLLYGEGAKAFTRLQEEIIKHTQDTTVFAWRLDQPPDRDCSGVFARSPADFAACGTLGFYGAFRDSSQMTNKGLQIRLNVWSHGPQKSKTQNMIFRPDFVYGQLFCFEGIPDSDFLIPLMKLEGTSTSITDGDECWRPPSSVPIRISYLGSSSRNDQEPPLECCPVPHHILEAPRSIKIYLRPGSLMHNPGLGSAIISRYAFNIEGLSSLQPDILLKEIFPHDFWLDGTRISRCELFTARAATPERVFLRFSTSPDRVDSVVIFEYQSRDGGTFIESNVLSWAQIHKHRQHKAKDIRVWSVVELFWNDPTCLYDKFWLDIPTAASQFLRVDATSTEPWIFNISKRL